MLVSWNYASLRASRGGLSTFCERLSILPKLPGAKSAAGLRPHRGSPKIVRMEPRQLGIRSYRLTKPQHRIPTPPIQSSRSGPHADCSSGVPHPGSQTVSFMPACLCFRGSSNIRDVKMEFCLMTAACLAKHFVSEVVVVPQFHFGSNFHSRHCSV